MIESRHFFSIHTVLAALMIAAMGPTAAFASEEESVTCFLTKQKQVIAEWEPAGVVVVATATEEITGLKVNGVRLEIPEDNLRYGDRFLHLDTGVEAEEAGDLSIDVEVSTRNAVATCSIELNVKGTAGCSEDELVLKTETFSVLKFIAETRTHQYRSCPSKKG